MMALLLVALLAAPAAEAAKSDNIYLHEGVSREHRWKSVGHQGVTLSHPDR